MSLEIINAEGRAEIAEGVGGEIGPSGPGEQEGVDPRTKAVAGEGTEEAFLGAVTVRDNGAAAELFFESGPEGKKRRSVEEVFLGDAVDFLGGPGDVLIALKK